MEICQRSARDQSCATYVWRVFEKALCNGVLKALKILVDLALFVQKHACGRL